MLRQRDDHPAPDMLMLPNDAMTNDDYYCRIEHADDAKLKSLVMAVLFANLVVDE